MVDKIGNISSHPLFAHLPVVLLPLTFLGLVLTIMSPSLRRRYGSLVIALLVLTTISTFLATRSGRTLLNEYDIEGRSLSPFLEDHVTVGERLEYLVPVHLLLVVVWMVRSRKSGPAINDDGSESRRPQIISAIVVILLLASGAAATALVLQGGYSGLRSVWEQVPVP